MSTGCENMGALCSRFESSLGCAPLNFPLTSAPTGYNPNHDKQKKKEKHQSVNFDEAWIEFHDKSVAKTVAKMLNAQVIGGKKGDRSVLETFRPREAH